MCTGGSVCLFCFPCWRWNVITKKKKKKNLPRRRQPCLLRTTREQDDWKGGGWIRDEREKAKHKRESDGKAEGSPYFAPLSIETLSKERQPPKRFLCVCVCVCVLGGCKEDEKREKGGRQIKYYPSICLLWCRHGVLRRWWRANMFSSFIPPNTALQGQREPVSGCCVSVRLGCWGLVCLARCLSLSVSMETSLSEPMCLS